LAGILIPRRAIWTRQPPFFLQAPYARELGFTHVWNFGSGELLARNARDGKYLLTPTGAIGLNPGGGGIGAKFPGSIGNRFEIVGNPFATSTGTWLWVESGTQTSAGGGVLVQSRWATTGTSAQGGLQIRFGGTDITILKAEVAGILTATDARSDSGVVSCGAFSVAGNNGRHVIFANGRQAAEVTPTVTYVHGTSAIGSENSGATGHISLSSTVYLLVFAPVVIPDPIIAQLTSNPWMLFQAPTRRIWIPGSAVGVTLSASAGSYSVSGQSAALKSARQIASTAGDYNAIGQVATLEYGRALPAAFGAYSVDGQTAAVVAARNIGAAAGSYGVAGQDAGLTTWRVVSASAGAYSLSGANAALVSVRHLPASSGTYASAGQSAALLTGLRLGANAASYDLTGESATFWIARASGLEAGSYAIAGQGAMLVYGTAAQVLAAAPGVFSVSGQIASLAKTSKLSLAAGTHAVAGSPAALRISRIIAAAAGSYGIIGSAASLSIRAAQAVLVASPGSFSLTGQSAAIKVTRRLASGSGLYAVAGQQSVLRRTALVNANAGDYSSTGQQVTFAYYRRIAASSGSLLVTGAAADLVRTVVVSAFVHGNRRVFEMSGRKRVVLVKRE